jgi:steroid delta-isomerase-like uncharacterized protein
MDALAVAGRYFGAWNQRDPEAITAVFTEDGTYTDPNVAGIGPQATAEYAKALFASFSDLAFEVESEADCGDGLVAARWRMTGTHDGSFQGLPPTGRSVSLPGADFIRVEDDRVRSVHGYFDTRVVPRQLGLQVLVQPKTVGPFSFGTSTYVSRAPTAPGAVSLTVLEAGSAEHREEVQRRSGEVVREMLGMPGFISWLGVAVEDRMFTITAWERPEDAARLRESPAHGEAMRRFFGPSLARGGQTGVWTPHRLGGMWVRCEACGRMARADADAGAACECGAALPEPPRYW